MEENSKKQERFSATRVFIKWTIIDKDASDRIRGKMVKQLNAYGLQPVVKLSKNPSCPDGSCMFSSTEINLERIEKTEKGTKIIPSG